MLFANSFCKYNSSEFSPIMPDKFREHLTRSFLHTEISSDSQIHVGAFLQFSPLIFYRVQVTDWDDHDRSIVLIFMFFFFWIIV